MIVFIIRRHNDIDHMAPIVYRMAKDGEKNMVLLSINPTYKIEEDFRLTFLKEKFNVKIDYLYNFFRPSIIHRFVSAMICNSSLRAVLSKLRLFDWFFEKFVKKSVFDKQWAISMIRANQISVIVFDSAMHNAIYNFKALHAASKTLNVPIVFVPHGMRISSVSQEHHKKIYLTTVNADPDYLVVPHNKQVKESIEASIDPDKVKVFGITRYCKEWMTTIDHIMPSQALPPTNKGLLKVLYIARGPGAHGNATNIVNDALDRISNLAFVHLIIKPHTRSNQFEFDQLSGRFDVATEIHTTNLIKWADVVIGTLSSALIEALIFNKALIFPKYSFGDTSRFKFPYFEDTACWKVNSHDELEAALKKLKEDPLHRPYSLENAEKFITEYVYNGETDTDVLGKYTNFINGLANKA